MNFRLLFRLENVLFLLSIFLYVFGLIWPDTFWATHFFYFLELKFFALFTLLIGAVLFLSKRNLFVRFRLNQFVIVVITILSFLIYYSVNISHDYYGDAKNFMPYKDEVARQLAPGFWNKFFSIQFKTGGSRWAVFDLYVLISYWFKVNINQVFVVMGALLGAGFNFLWFQFVKRFVTNVNQQIVLVAVGCLTPVGLLFCGHLEVYALVLFLTMFWLYVLVIALAEKNKNSFWVSLLILVVLVKFNTISILLIPVVFLSGVWLYFGSHPKLRLWFQSYKIVLYTLLPIAVLGLLAYFFVFQSHNDSRELTNNVQDIDRLFLPLFSPQSPLDTYNLLSFNHVFDYLMVFAFLGGSLVFIVFVVISKRQQLFDNPLINLLSISILLYLGFLFMINPLMSLPVDWDLYMQVFPFVLVWLLLVFKEENIKIDKTLVCKVLILSLMSLSAYPVLSHVDRHSKRFEAVGVRVYKTYYQHSGSYMLYALQMNYEQDAYKQRKDALLKKLKPFQREPKDRVMAELHLDQGIIEYYKRNYIESKAYLNKAKDYYPNFEMTNQYLDSVSRKLKFKKK